MSIASTDNSFGMRLGASRRPRPLLSERLLKKWFEPVIPFTVTIVLLVWFAATIPNYAGLENLLSLVRLYAEFGFVALAMAFSLISGGIDLSVGAIFAACNVAALYFLSVLELPAWATVRAALAVGGVIGAVTCLLIGYLK